jgi:hypothetical protein
LSFLSTLNTNLKNETFGSLLTSFRFQDSAVASPIVRRRTLPSDTEPDADSVVLVCRLDRADQSICSVPLGGPVDAPAARLGGTEGDTD